MPRSAEGQGQVQTTLFVILRMVGLRLKRAFLLCRVFLIYLLNISAVKSLQFTFVLLVGFGIQIIYIVLLFS